MVIPGSGWPISAKGRFPEANSRNYDYLFRGGKYPDYLLEHPVGRQFQPRVGIAYQLNDKTVIRAGGGRFFTRLGVSDSVFLGGNPPFQPTANVSFGSADNPGGTSPNSLPLTVTTQSRDFKNPEAWNWNFTVEREILSQVGSQRGLRRPPRSAPAARDQHQPADTAAVLANPGVNIDALRPYKGYNSIRETDNVASSRYNSLQVPGIAASRRACCSAQLIRFSQEHGRWIESARHHPRHLLCAQPVGSVGIRTPPRVHRQFPV